MSSQMWIKVLVGEDTNQGGGRFFVETHAMRLYKHFKLPFYPENLISNKKGAITCTPTVHLSPIQHCRVPIPDIRERETSAGNGGGSTP